MRELFKSIKDFIKICLRKVFVEYAPLVSVVCAVASLITIGLSLDVAYSARAYSQKLEIELQNAEVDSNAYRILWQNEKEQSYIYYDQLRQIQANQEAQEALNNDQNN